MFISRLLSGIVIALLLSSNVVHAQDVPLDKSAVMTRADFVKLIVERMYTEEEIKHCFTLLSPSEYQLLFTDVSIHESYGPSLCVAMYTGIVRGYEDGSFRPNKIINFAEASKIYTRAFSLSPAAGHSVSDPWFKGSVEALASRGAIPMNVKTYAQQMTYLTHEEILKRITNDLTFLDSQTYDSLAIVR